MQSASRPCLPPVSSTEAPAAPASERQLTSDIDLGAGSSYGVLADISLKTLGKDPRFSLSFNHETLDGFSGQRPGSGFNLRNDDLNGDLKFRIGSVDTEIGGSFSENESGLQRLSPFDSALGRTLDGTVGFSAVPLGLADAFRGRQGGTDSLTLEGAQSAHV